MARILEPKESGTLPCSCIDKVSSFTSRPYEWKFPPFPWKQPIQPLHKNISQGHTRQQRNVSHYWCGEALVRVTFVLEGSNISLLVWMHGIYPYYVYLIEGFLDHGTSKGLVHALQKGRLSIKFPISDSYISFFEIIFDFAALLGLNRFNRRRYGRES